MVRGLGLSIEGETELAIDIDVLWTVPIGKNRVDLAEIFGPRGPHHSQLAHGRTTFVKLPDS
jgi:hypothetical protein